MRLGMHLAVCLTALALCVCACLAAPAVSLAEDVSLKTNNAPIPEENEERPRYRALLIGEQAYQPEVNTVRTGAVNTLEHLQSLFGLALYDGTHTCAVTLRVDVTAEETLAAVGEVFRDAAEGDVSILYLSCHGFFRDGTSILQFVDGSCLAACDLEQALRKVPGTVVVLADCCGSGGFVQVEGEAKHFADGFARAFAGETPAFADSRYKVLCSAAPEEDSYRLGYGDSEGEVATVFGMALCDALGWDMQNRQKGSLSADMNYDGRITLWEAYLYIARRVPWYLSLADGGTGRYAQNVQAYPEGDGFLLFER